MFYPMHRRVSEEWDIARRLRGAEIRKSEICNARLLQMEMRPNLGDLGFG